MIIRSIKEEEMDTALKLVWEVFLEFEAPDYTEEGIALFKSSIDDREWINKRVFYGAYDDDNNLLGVIATFNTNHISLFFVDGKHHKLGIGRKLYDLVESLNKDEYFTVNSSPYAHNIYKHIGFIDTDVEQNVCGLRFFPMKKVLKK